MFHDSCELLEKNFHHTNDTGKTNTSCIFINGWEATSKLLCLMKVCMTKRELFTYESLQVFLYGNRKMKFQIQFNCLGEGACACTCVFVCPAEDHYYPPLSNLFYRAPGPLLSSLCLCLNGTR